MLEFGTANPRFAGISCLAVDRPEPFPDLTGLKGCFFGNSLAHFVSDNTVDLDTELPIPLPVASLRDALGVRDLWSSGLNSTDFIADNGGANSTALERAPYDIDAHDFDFVIDVSGLNDTAADPTALNTAATDFYAARAAANPGTVFFVTGCLNLAAPYAGVSTVSDAKEAGVAPFPESMVFIDVSDWATGTGNVSSPAGNGNADLIRGSDGIHHSAYSAHEWLGRRLAAAMDAAIDALVS